MVIHSFEDHGRKLLVEFECRRCRTTATRTLEECLKELEAFNDLYNLRPPKEWEDGGFYYPLFCPDCKKAYAEFMDGKGANNG